MVARNPFGPAPVHPGLDGLPEQTRDVEVTEELFREQRISLAYGNAME